MAYLALYRRFRPSGFDGLIGQEHVVKILKNQIKTGKIGHAYLFCGARGTGKTTVAKVFARAINCLDPKDGSPCGRCEVCLGLKDGANMDILEMDAASNNGVDDIREMREKIQYPPVVGKYKVYIVDEVHMLSTAAFNALLKTLEEPPAHAVFIFATTEVHKIPQTILSRCMRFDFKLIPQSEIADLIRRVFREVGKEYEEDAVEAIARAGEGSARDALSIADTCSSYSRGKLTYADVLEVLGTTDAAKITELAKDIVLSDAGAALSAVNGLNALGKNMSVLADDLAAVFRDLIICKTSKDPNAVLGLPKEKLASYQEIADLTDGHRLLRIVEIFTSLDNAFRYSAHPRIVLETAVVKACRPDKDYDLEALLSRIASLEKEAAELKEMISKTPVNIPANGPKILSVPEATEKQEMPKTEKVPDIAQKSAVSEEITMEEAPPEEESFIFSGAMNEPPAQAPAPETPTASDVNKAESVPPAKLWGNVLKTLRSNGNAVLWTVCRDVSARTIDGVLTITVNDDGEYEMFTREDHFKTLSDAAAQFGDYTVRIERKPQQVNIQDEFERDVRELKDIFGDDAVKIIK